MNNNELNIFTHFTHDIYMSPQSLNPRYTLASHPETKACKPLLEKAIRERHIPSHLPLWVLDRILDLRGKAHFLTWLKGQVCSQQSMAGEGTG